MTTRFYQPSSLSQKWQNSAYMITRSLGRIAARLELKRQEIPLGGPLSYYDNNNNAATETLVLVHGFNADKDHWIAMTLYLSRYRVIIPDLGGHGQSCYDPTLAYDIPLYARQLNQLMNALCINRFHLLGNSMGGWVAAWYAHQYPSEVVSLGLMNACGVASPVLSPFFRALAQQKNPFFYSNPTEFAAMLDIAVANPRAIPKSIRAVNYRHGLTRMDKARKLFADITNPEQTYLAPAQQVDDLLRQVQQPTLVLWGDRDGIMDPSMADVFCRGLPHCEKRILPGVGHTPMLEKPALAARCYKEFLQRL
ncbi:MAG TPA: alpha/beta hydrolase [Dongiaceae bacterium]|nr:alpha/beta hydrolase [Dongiaceae bacterium]